MADESLFTSQTPGSQAFDATGISLGLTVKFALAGVVKALKFYAHTTLSGGTYTGGIYSVDIQDGGPDDPGTGTGTLLGSANYGALTAGAWNTVTLGANVTVAANTPYRLVGYSSVGRYTSTASLFSSDLVNGNITGIAHGSTVDGKLIRNGTYNYAAGITYPNDHFSGEGYFVDCVYEADPVAAAAAPPALVAPTPAVVRASTW